jgi:shikimate kinase
VISLVGLPGCGKSTVGWQLARRLRQPFFDADKHIEQQLGCSIRDWFANEGEASFRAIETEVLNRLTQGGFGVLSTGGGAVLATTNRIHLHARTRVVYLNAAPEQLMRRLRHDTQRPLLQVADPLARLRELHAQRDPLYREVAHYVVETGRPSVLTLVNTIIAQLELNPLPGAAS